MEFAGYLTEELVLIETFKRDNIYKKKNQGKKLSAVPLRNNSSSNPSRYKRHSYAWLTALGVYKADLLHQLTEYES